MEKREDSKSMVGQINNPLVISTPHLYREEMTLGYSRGLDIDARSPPASTTATMAMSATVFQAVEDTMFNGTVNLGNFKAYPIQKL